MNTMRIYLISVLCLVGAAACTTSPEPRVEVQRVLVPVPTFCEVEIPQQPQYQDTRESLKQAQDLYNKSQLILSGREQRDGYIEELEGALNSCQEPQPQD